MEFKWNDEQQLMQTMFREFVDKELRPIAAELDEQERFPSELIPKMGEIGLLGIPIAEEFGGVGMGSLEVPSLQKTFDNYFPWLSLWISAQCIQTNVHSVE